MAYCPHSGPTLKMGTLPLLLRAHPLTLRADSCQ